MWDELDSDFCLGGCSGAFFLEELEEDELFDFFLSTGGKFSLSLELSDERSLIGSATGGFAGSTSGTSVFSFG